jgi:proline iminopeptidase
MLPVRGGRIWYKVSGTGRERRWCSSTVGRSGSFYLKPFEDLGDDRRVIRYDQLGAGKSDRLTDTTLMVIPRFVEELDSLRRALGIDKWFLNSQSWGTCSRSSTTRRIPSTCGIVFGWSCSTGISTCARRTRGEAVADSSQRAIDAWKKGGSAERRLQERDRMSSTRNSCGSAP